MKLSLRLHELKRKIRSAWQRATKGYSREMLWDMDVWFCETLPKMILELRDNLHSFPEVAFEEVEKMPQEWLSKEISRIKEGDAERLKNDYDPFDIKEALFRWEIILSRIAYCLQEAHKFNDCAIKNKHQDEFSEHIWKETDAPMDKEFLNRYYTEEDKVEKYKDEMKNEAFKLLSKYFYHLWD